MNNRLFGFLVFPFYLFSVHGDQEKLLQLKERVKQEQRMIKRKKNLVRNLEKHIEILEFSLIQKRIESWEEKLLSHKNLPPSLKEEGLTIFFQERKFLTNLLSKRPQDPLAQNLLDRILRLITLLKRDKED